MQKKLYKSLILVFSAMFFACGQEEEHIHEEEVHEEGLVTLTPVQADAIDLLIGPMQMKNLTATIQTNGRLEVPPQNEAASTASVGGNIHRIQVIEGDQVRKGQILAYLEHPDLIDMQSELQDLASRIDYLREEYERQRRLYEKQVVAGKVYQKAAANYRAAQSRLEALKQKLSILNINVNAVAGGKIYRFIPVVSPISGYIRKVNIRTGQYVPPQEEMFHIINNDHVHADLMVFEKDLFLIRKGQKVMVQVANAPEREYTAKIYAVGKAFEEEPKALHVHAEIENKSGTLLPGMYVKGRIIVEDYKTLALPDDAVTREGNKSYIFVKVEETETLHQHTHETEDEQEGHEEPELHQEAEHDHDHAHTEEHPHAGEVPVKDSKALVFRMVEVATGVRDMGWIEIQPLEDIPADAEVALNGAYYLLSEMKKGEAGHSH